MNTEQLKQPTKHTIIKGLAMPYKYKKFIFISIFFLAILGSLYLMNQKRKLSDIFYSKIDEAEQNIHLDNILMTFLDDKIYYIVSKETDSNKNEYINVQIVDNTISFFREKTPQINYDHTLFYMEDLTVTKYYLSGLTKKSTYSFIGPGFVGWGDQTNVLNRHVSYIKIKFKTSNKNSWPAN